MATAELQAFAQPISITAVFSPSARQAVEHTLQLVAGSHVEGALAILRSKPGFEALQNLGDDAVLVGLWGRRVDVAVVLRDGDRLEIYRPLLVDPKTARRLRFKGQSPKKQSAGLFSKRREGGKAGY